MGMEASALFGVSRTEGNDGYFSRATERFADASSVVAQL